ncbi:MAG: type II toxin-antitoxin system RelE/ParE family toxin [Bdellovibrionaceae bacterium]|nr:type II toxin-antitoxin system RelE/ParE family toxin [Pseudobdellovibrionaceae bacterium]
MTKEQDQNRQKLNGRSTRAYRFFYFVKKADGLYFVHAFKKKTQELPQKEIEVVLKRLKEV